MSEGHIKWFNAKKGYGFITTKEQGDIFVHEKQIKEYGYFGYTEGDPVSFDIRETQKGKQAFNVRPLNSP